MDFSKYINPIGMLVFIIALSVYILTAQQSVMFWDSGEFIASSIKMQVTHPPGAPLYTILSRIFLMIFPKSLASFGASIFSAICGALTVWFLFHTIIWFGNKVVATIGSEKIHASSAVILAAVVGAFSLTFSDSFWVSSTEAEVYTLSTFFMAASFWAISKWDLELGVRRHRWVLLIVFLLGLSMGVHVLNLAILFPLSTFISIRKFGFSIKSIIIGLGSALLLFIGFNNLLVQGFLQVLASIEITAVNEWNWSQHSGSLLGIAIFACLLAFGLLWSTIKKRPFIQLNLIGIVLFSIGWSTYATTIIRSDANTSTSNHANDVISLIEYLRSSQFGFSDRPLFYGPTFMSVRDSKKEFLKSDPIYAFSEQEKKYVIVDDGTRLVPNYMSETKMLFSRMWGKNYSDVEDYKKWINYRGKEVPVTINIDGKDQRLIVPTMLDNLDFFFTYQLGWLNYRYFMWNFVGRQNDKKGVGTPDAGNWVSGLSLFDESRIGSSKDIPSHYKNDKSKNEYYFLPLLLGLIGFVFLMKKSKSEFLVLFIFFLAFGVAVTVFINQLPIHIQIRERDYIFLGAYYAFCGFIGIGVLGLIYSLSLKINTVRKSLVVGGICLLLVPGLMGFKAWDDHDRSNDIAARRLAKNMLDQCDKNAILFTAGDNITFPLWYMQEVEEYRTDVRIVDYNLLALSWYSKQLRRQVNDSPPIKFSLCNTFYKMNQKEIYPMRKNPQDQAYIEATEFLNQLSSSPKNQFISNDQLKITVDTSQLSLMDIDPAKYEAVFTSEIAWNLNKSDYSLRDFAMIDILSQNKFQRPIYFSFNNSGTELFQGLEDYLVNKGMVYQLLPLASKTNQELGLLMDTDAMQELIENQLVFDEYSDGNQFSNALNSNFVRIIYIPIYYNVAYAHYLKGELDKCVEVANLFQKTFPNQRILYDQYMFKFAALYYEANDMESWRKLSNTVMKNLMDEFHWYTSFDPQHDIITYERVQTLLSIINLIKNDINTLDKPLSQELNPRMLELDQQYRKWIAKNALFKSLKNKGNNLSKE